MVLPPSSANWLSSSVHHQHNLYQPLSFKWISRSLLCWVPVTGYQLIIKSIIQTIRTGWEELTACGGLVLVPGCMTALLNSPYNQIIYMKKWNSMHLRAVYLYVTINLEWRHSLPWGTEGIYGTVEFWEIHGSAKFPEYSAGTWGSGNAACSEVKSMNWKQE
jgi:hypothetical protein